jgi:hypothetical protein
MTEAAGFSPKARVAGASANPRTPARMALPVSASMAAATRPMARPTASETVSPRRVASSLSSSARAAGEQRHAGQRQPGGQRAARFGGPGCGGCAPHPERHGQRHSRAARPGQRARGAHLCDHAERERQQPDRRHGLGLQHDGQRRDQQRHRDRQGRGGDLHAR